MSLSRRKFMKSGIAAAVGLALWHESRREVDAADVTPETAPIVAGPFQPNWELAEAVQVSGVVPGRQVRHLGALDRPVRPGAGRLVRPPDVYPGQRRLPVPV